MNPNLESIDVRKQIIKDIKGNENIERKRKAFVAYEIFKDKIHDHVYNYLVNQFGSESAKAMPVISSINIAKKVVTEESSVYTTPPMRAFSEADDAEIQILEDVLKAGKFNAKLKKANEYFKLYKGQVIAQVILQDKKLNLRILLPHQVDVIPDVENPEKAYAYITSSFDKSQYVKSDRVNQIIADQDDAKALAERYTVWTKDLNFIMNGRGEIVSDPTLLKNDIGVLPFVDISSDKDGEFFVVPGETDTDFTIQYNAAMSDLQNIVRLQGYAQAVFTGDPDSMPQVIRTGPGIIIKLPINPNAPVPTDFKFATPSPDIAGSLQALEMLLANFLTTRGVDAKVIAGKLDSSTTYSSGVERLLAMLEEFEASQDDFEVFACAEHEIFEVVKAWLVKYSNTELLDRKYWIKPKTQSATMSVSFSRPEAVKTETEIIADMGSAMDMGLEDRITACMKLKGMTEDQAVEYLDKIDARKAQYGKPQPPQTQGFGGGFYKGGGQ